MRIRLSDRLQMSASMAGHSATVADVGCDHAHTCIWLLQNNAADRCIGTDVRSGPLGKARENIALYGVSDRVELRLGYGLDRLEPGEADTIIIAGMGGDMIRDILEKDRIMAGVTREPPFPVLILQPQTHFYSVRQWLYDCGYTILDEDMCREDDKFYPCIRAVYGRVADGGVHKAPEPAEIYYGPVLIAKKHPVLTEYLQIEARKKKYLLGQIEKSTAPEAQLKLDQVREQYGIILRAIGMCGGS